MRTTKNGIIATTGVNPIYEIIGGEKIYTNEYENRYMNEKVEKELVEFKKEIKMKFYCSQINKEFIFLRADWYEKSERDSKAFKVIFKLGV